MEQKFSSSKRIVSIDIVRGIIMILMVLDHVRSRFTGAALALYPSPALISDVTNISVSTPFLFSMRWITHLCAPGFVFLAGVSIYFWDKKYGKTQSVPKHFVLRGLMLVGVDIMLNCMSIVRFSGVIYMGVLWAIGVSMMLFPLVRTLSTTYKLCLIIAIVLISNSIHMVFPALSNDILRILLIKGELSHLSAPALVVNVGYPVLPWFAVMLSGLVFAQVFTYEKMHRQKILLFSGLTSICSFVLLRIVGEYGDTLQYSPYDALWQSVASFINITKYPPSLQYLLITLGIIFLILSLVEYLEINSKILMLFGTTPLFFYCIHLFIIKIVTFILKRVGDIFPVVTELSFTTYGIIIYSVIILVFLYPLCLLYKSLSKRFIQ